MSGEGKNQLVLGVGVGSMTRTSRDKIIYVILFATFRSAIPRQLSQIVRVPFFGNLTIMPSFQESGMDSEVHISLIIGNRYSEITSLLHWNSINVCTCVFIITLCCVLWFELEADSQLMHMED